MFNSSFSLIRVVTRLQSNSPVSSKLFLYNLPKDVGWYEIKDHFQEYGFSGKADIHSDQKTGELKGTGLFYLDDDFNIDDVVKKMHGSILNGFAIGVIRHTPRVGSLYPIGKLPSAKVVLEHRVFVAKLPHNITWQAVKHLFSTEVGEVEYVKLKADPITQVCRGYGVVQFKNKRDVGVAISKLNNASRFGTTLCVQKQRPDAPDPVL